MAKRGGSSLRTKIVAVLASLVALWSFAAYVTVREGVSLVFFATLEQQVAKPHEAVVAALEAERRASVAYVAGPADALPSSLDTIRAATDGAVHKLRSALSGTLAKWSESDTTQARLADELRGLDTLPNTRSRIDLRRLDAVDTATYFSGLIRTGFAVYDSFTVWNNADVIFQTTTLLAITHLQETISQEDALMAGVLGAGVFTEPDRAQFAQLVGAQRYLSAQISDRLDSGDRARYDDLDATPPLVSLRAIEDVIVAAPPGSVPLTDPGAWLDAVGGSITGIRAFLLYLADATVQRVQPAGIWIVVRLLLAAGLGLAAVVFSIRFSVRTVRSMQRQLAGLRIAALDLAEVRLPDVVTRLRAGEEVDVETSAPPPAYGTDDIGLVGRAFHAVQQTAIRATVEQAELRRGVRDVFLNLARRSQALIHRQLKLIDTMERRAGTDEELAELFRIDHLATRMRRNAENLIVLSGATAGRGWRDPVRMVDVVRGALAEVEDYPRIEVRLADSAALTGRAVGDVIHLLAELMENAVSFSPPSSSVSVTGARAAGGYIIEISDHGLGMSDADLLEANAQIENPPEFQMSSTARLGFYVVGRLAQRHQIRVTLEPNAAGGTTAVVLIPPALVTAADPNDPGANIDTAPTRPLPAHPAAHRVGSVDDQAAWQGAFPELPAPTAAPALPARLVEEELSETPIGEVGPRDAYTSSGLPVRPRKPRPRPTAPGDAASQPAVPRPRTPDAPFNPVRGTATVRTEAPAGNGGNAGNGNGPGGNGPGGNGPGPAPNGRSPEDVRRMMAAYQAGTRRARAAGDGHDAPHRMARHESDSRD